MPQLRPNKSVDLPPSSASSLPSRSVAALWRGDFGLLLAALIALFVILPLLQPGLPATADTPIHFYRALEFGQSWGPGVVYPRWATDLAYGYGYPLWVFAPPLPYIAPLMFTGAGASLEIGLKGMIILAVLIYALGAYLFVRQHLGPKAGLIGAAIYTLAPFALREVLLYGGNYPQYLAVGLYPWVLWGLGRINRRANWLNILLTAILYGAVMLSHLFHVLVLTPVAALYALTLTIPSIQKPQSPGPTLSGKSKIVNPKSKIQNLLASALAMALGLLWTAFFWIPAFFERPFTRSTDDVYLAVSPIFSRFLNWGELLAWPRPLDARAANPWIPFSLGIGAIFLALLGMIALFWPRKALAGQESGDGANRGLLAAQKRRSRQLQALFFLLLLATIIFMMLPISTSIWTSIPLLAVAEFPWRLLGLANLSLAFLGGSSALLFRESSQATDAATNYAAVSAQRPAPSISSGQALSKACLEQSQKVAGPVILSAPNLFTIAAVIIVLLSSAVYLYPPRSFVYYDGTLMAMGVYELTTRTIGTTTLGEYLPVWVKDVPTTSPIAEGLTHGESVEKLEMNSLPDEASAQLLEHTAVSDVYRFDSLTPFQARFYTFYYPGWTAQLDDQTVAIAIERESGLITVPIPAGLHTLRLTFSDTPLRTAANLLSFATVGILFLALAGSAILRPFGFAQGKLRSERALNLLKGQARPSRPKTRGADPLQAQADEKAGWRGRPLLCAGGALIALLLLKALLIDPYTGWFRQESSPGQAVGKQQALQNNLNNQFKLLGYDLNRETTRPGQSLQVVLYWQALRSTESNYRSFVHLDSPIDQRTWAISDNFHPGDATAQIDIPTSSWDTEHYVRDEHFLSVPLYAPPVEFNLRAGLYDPNTGRRIALADGSGDVITLQSVQILPNSGNRQPRIPNPVKYRLGDHIELLGYDWDESKSTLSLFWQSNQPLPDDYVVFVHWLNEKGQLVLGDDGPPLGGLYPTSAWRPHSIIVDIRPLDLSDLPPGKYSLAIGLYHPDTLLRLPVADARGRSTPDKAIRLTRITKGE